MRRKELTEEQWRKIAPLLPPQKPQRGRRPARDHRIIVNAVLWVLRAGAPRRDPPERYGPWQTAASRFYRWRDAGAWQRVLGESQRQKDRSGEVGWEVHFVDSTVVRAHRHAASAKGGGAVRR